MSMDLEIWSADAFKKTESLPGTKWGQHGEGQVYSEREWQLVIDESVEVDADDVPEEVEQRSVGVRFLTRLTLEPIHAPASAHALLRKTARAVASATNGVVYDPQTKLISGKTVMGKAPVVREERQIDLLTLTWWFLQGPLTTREGLEELLSYFSRHLPQFLPRRYGDFEPPKYRFDGKNISHFSDLALTVPFGFVWETGTLFSVEYWPTNGPGWEDDRYRIPRLELTCPAAVLAEPGWQTELQRCWKAVTQIAEPMYADVRVLHNYTAKRNRLIFHALARHEHHPLVGPWRGLPASLGLAAAVGEPYLNLWPTIREKADHQTDSFAACSLGDWRRGGDLKEVIGYSPSQLCRPDEGDYRSRRLAEEWPFEPKPEGM